MTNVSTEFSCKSSSELTDHEPCRHDKGKVRGYELSLFRNASLADIQFLFNFIDRFTLNRVIDELMNAERVFILGSGENYSSAMFMSYLGSMQFGNWGAIQPSTKYVPGEEPETFGRADVVFAISTAPSEDKNPFKDFTIQIAKCARDGDAIVVAVVDERDTALTTLASHVLYVPCQSDILRSHVVTAILVETIIGVTVIRSDISMPE